MSIIIASTTDSKEAVIAAQGDLAEDKKIDEVIDDSKKSASEENSLDEKKEDSEPSEDDEIEASGEEDGEDKAEVEQKPKAKGGFKKRIDKLNSKLSAAEQEKEYWRKEALKAQSPAPEKQSNEAKSEKNSEGKPKAENFETHEDYVEAVTDWKVDQKLLARDAKQKESSLKTEYQQQVDTFISRKESFAETHDDFNDLIESVDDVPMSLTVQEVILSSENGPELMYELAKNKEEYKRICALPAIAAARELGRFETKLAKASATIEAKELKTTKAPKPISPISATSTGGVKKSIDDPNISQREFERLREEQIAKRATY